MTADEDPQLSSVDLADAPATAKSQEVNFGTVQATPTEPQDLGTVQATPTEPQDLGTVQATPTEPQEEFGTVQATTPEPHQERFDPKKYEIETASKLAFWLILLLGLSFFVHYACVAIFASGIFNSGNVDTIENNTKAVEMLSTAFNVWLPVISGLAGAAVTYYFTQGKQR